jgi:hypothetical protein
MFAVIKHHERATSTDEPRNRSCGGHPGFVRQAKGPDHGDRHHGLIGQRRQVHHPDSGREPRQRLGRDLQGKTSLARRPLTASISPARPMKEDSCSGRLCAAVLAPPRSGCLASTSAPGQLRNIPVTVSFMRLTVGHRRSPNISDYAYASAGRAYFAAPIAGPRARTNGQRPWQPMRLTMPTENQFQCPVILAVCMPAWGPHIYDPPGASRAPSGRRSTGQQARR